MSRQDTPGFGVGGKCVDVHVNLPLCLNDVNVMYYTYIYIYCYISNMSYVELCYLLVLCDIYIYVCKKLSFIYGAF